MQVGQAVRHVAAVSAFIAVAALSGSARNQAPASRHAPTAQQDPDTTDQAWRTAISKYAHQRAIVLQQLERVVREGPFRPDWESLQTYDVPEWYRDAKFGIFIHWGVY